MNIDRINLYHISQKLVRPFVTSFGVQHERHCLLLAISSEGLTGWGECSANISPGYSYETTETAWHILTEFLIPELLKGDIEDPEELAPILRFVRGHPLAKASIDLAIWDIIAQGEGLSLAQKLAQPFQEGSRDKVKVGVSIGIQPSIEETLELIGEYLSTGYQRVKLKIRPGHDLVLAREVRKNFPELQIMLDANSAYRLADVNLFQELDDLDLLMMEQPLSYDDIYDHSQLRPMISTPLCLDESITNLKQARFALAIGACDIINIKPGRVGGWTEARKIHDLCRSKDVPVWVGGMLETGVGRAGQLALASLPGFTLPGDISATSRYYHEDVAQPDYVLNKQDSTITVPSGPGLGVKVDPERLEAATIRHISFNQ